jgi:hypothetical protein
MPKGGARAGAGRKPTVHGVEKVQIRISPELLEEVRAYARREHVSMSESFRMALRVMVNSPGDLWAAMVEDPEAVNAEFVARVVDDRSRSVKRAVAQ